MWLFVFADVLVAMNVPREYGLGTLRVSFGRHSLLTDVDQIAACIVDAVITLQKTDINCL